MNLLKRNIYVYALMILCCFSCKKENTVTVESAVWVKVLEDSEITSTDEELYQGRNGKVITDISGSIYLYYYNSKKSQTTIVKCTGEGTVLWRKSIGNIAGMDMVALNNGSVVLAGADPVHIKFGMTLYAFRPNGTIDSLNLYPKPSYTIQYEDNVCLYAMDDNSIVMSGSSPWEPGGPGPYRNKTFFIKIDPSFQEEWNKNYWFIYPPITLGWYEYWNQNSIIQTANNQFLFQYAVETNPTYTDSNYYELVTGLLNSDGSYDTTYRTTTGYHWQSKPNKTGVKNRYTNGLMHDGYGGFIFHYSNPTVFGNTPIISSGFLRIGADAFIKDTVPIPLPDGYRITSCNYSNGKFLLSAYKSGIVNGTSDYLAERTIFLSGGADLITTNTFKFQDFYSDFFSSIASAKDGSFLIMGKVQSFNGSSNKLVLIKYKSF